jgi:apolipoprotein N-acyltransferase
MRAFLTQEFYKSRLVRQIVWGLLGATASGVLFGLSLPPYDVPLLGFVAFVPVLVASFYAPPFASILYGLLTGFIVYFVLVFLRASAGDFGVALPFLVFGILLAPILTVARLLKTEKVGRLIIGVGSGGVITEWVAARVDFPYTVALALWRDAPALWLAGWTGAWGLSFLIWAVNTTVATFLATLRIHRSAVMVLAILGLVYGMGWFHLLRFQPHETLRVAVVQGPQGSYGSLLLQASQGKAHLVVLPEVCCTEREASDWARRYGLSIIFGFYSSANGAALATPDGKVSKPYYKMHPYGEPASWKKGQPIRAFPSPYGTLGAVICYDTMFTDSCRYQALNGARLIAVPTIDPVVPAYAFHYLHAATTTLRAAEHRVPMARSEYTAASMIVDGYGRVLAEAKKDEPKLIMAEVPLSDGRGTLYTRLGDYFVALCVLLMGAVLLRIRPGRKRQSEHRDNSPWR